MPELRKKLRTVSSKNRALQDILRTCGDAVEVVSVEKLTGSVHNTKTILNMPDGQQRVHFYNRVPIQNTIPEGFLSSGDVELDIEILNTLYGCDFTEDDLVITCGKYSAKADSLGYHSEAGVAGSILPADIVSFNLNIPDHVKQNWSENIVTPLMRIRTETSPGIFVEEVVKCAEVNVPSSYNSTDWNNFINDVYVSLTNGRNQLDELVIDMDLTEIIEQAQVNMVSWGHDAVIRNYSLKAINLTNKIIEVCITLAHLREESNDGPKLLKLEYATWVILPNTRLLPKGYTLPYCPMHDMLRFKTEDFIDFNDGMWNGADHQPGEVLYKGEYLGINRSTKNSYIVADGYVERVVERPFGNLIDVDVEDAGGGLANLLRVFVNGEMYHSYTLLSGKEDYLMLGPYALILKNPFDTALEVNHAFFSKPAQFAPCKNETHPDEIFVYWGTVGNVFNSEPDLNLWEVEMDGVELASGSNMSRRGCILEAIANNTNPKVDITLLTEPSADAVFLHIRNRSDARVGFKTIKGGEDEIVNIILEPSGTLGEKLSFTDGDAIDLFEDVIGDEVIQFKNYTFRGVTRQYSITAQLSLQTLNQVERDFDYWPLSPIPEKVTVTYVNLNLDIGEEGYEFEKTYFIKPQPIPRFAFEERF